MSELSLPALTESDRPVPPKARLPIQELNSAYKCCKFGLFHIRLLATAFTGFLSGVLVSNTTSYLLPMAECDLKMSLIQKGLLNAIPYLGMLLSSIAAGFLTDAFGRKLFVVIGQGGMFIFMLIAGSSQTYEVLVTAKFFEGVLFACSFSALLTLTSEFCHDGIRDRVMLAQSSFAAISQVLVPAMSWGVFTYDWKVTLFDGWLVLNTWNFYLYAMSLWSLTACLLYLLTIPESPKFLITKNKYEEAREILVKMYRQNTWKPAHTFPYANIWKDRVKQVLTDVEEEKEHSFSHQIVVGLHNVKPMFQKPLGGYLALICSMNFLIMALYNIIRLWFPQLSTIVEHYKVDDPNQDLCDMLDTYTSDLRVAARNATDRDICVPTKSGAETYINSMIMGCVCLLPYFVTGVLVNRVGKKILLIAAGALSVASMLSIRWASSKVAIVALFSTSTAIAQVSMSLVQAITVEVFPTTTRHSTFFTLLLLYSLRAFITIKPKMDTLLTLAISLMMVFGRIGTLVGNIMFPILLDMACEIPFFTLSGMMVALTVMYLFLPKTSKK